MEFVAQDAEFFLVQLLAMVVPTLVFQLDIAFFAFEFLLAYVALQS